MDVFCVVSHGLGRRALCIQQRQTRGTLFGTFDGEDCAEKRPNAGTDDASYFDA